ncbi:hypothetical protein [Gramella sp. Hel_I_59]|uniref:hypothetical protein n=1 Tax=Gramella sp. Hel_I_59 TaxID=1249978 RepID=UPI001153921B|nr:hypothetical protein [Gramella sp. Hel_I_59]
MKDQSKLFLLTEEGFQWYPNSIQFLDKHFMVLIKKNDNVKNDELYPRIKNLSYSLQYIQFIKKVISDINLTSVLWTQNVKALVIQGASVIESIFDYLVKCNGLANKTEWSKVRALNTSEYQIENKKFKNEVIIHEKLDSEKDMQMSFDQMAKKVEKKKLLGENYQHYSSINALRKLRNKIHIHDSEHYLDTDWNNFNDSQYQLVCKILHSILTSELFEDSDYTDKFDFLISSFKKNIEM